MSQGPSRAGERGMTLIELAIVIVVLGVLLTLATAAVVRARLAANEGSAIAGLRTVNTAQFQYQSTCGNGLYAASAVVLSRVPPGHTQGYLPAELGSGFEPVRSGYVYSVRIGSGGVAGPADCGGTPTVTAYVATARPESAGAGTRSFATTNQGTVWETNGTTPPAQPFGPPARLAGGS